MALDYNQRRELNAKISQTSQNIVAKVIIYGLEGIKFVANFIGDMVKQAMGK